MATLQNQASAAERTKASIPSHVPPELVRSYEFSLAPGFEKDPYGTAAKLYDGPRIFYNIGEYRGQGWMLTRYEDIRDVLQDAATFSSKRCAGFSELVGETWDMNPLELDPPRHTKFRMLLNPLFAPARVDELEGKIRDLAVSLIEKFKNAGHCEFVDDFARQYPVTIFLQLMGLPLSEVDKFLEWEYELLHSLDLQMRVKGATSILHYLRALIAERRKNPTDDFAGFVAKATLDGKPLDDDDVMGIYYLLFVGGLDTVVASLGFMFKYLAEHPEQQQELRRNLNLIPDAVEELLRAHSVIVTRRFCTRDVEFRGIKMKKGDCVMVPTMMGSRDPAEFEKADQVIFDRQQNRHLAFSAGPHRCIGSHLARRELRIAFEEFLTRIPEFHVAPGAEIKAHGGVWGIDRLPLVWTVSR